MRVFGILALLFGALHLGIGLMGLSEYEFFKSTFGSMIQYAQKNQIRGYEGITAEAATLSIRIVIAFTIAIGVASLVCGIGLLTRRLWAAKAWLSIVSIAAGVYAYRTISAVMAGDSAVSLILLSLLVLILLCASWLKLYKVRQ